MKNLKGAIFDMDGVIVDNHRFHFEAWLEFSRKYKFLLNEDIYRDRFNGKTNADLFKMIFGEVTPVEIAKYAEEKEGHYRRIYAPHLRPLKGLEDFLDFLKRHRFKLALGTSAPTPNVDFVLDGLRLRRYFDVVVDGSQVERGKPDPEVYQMCVNRLGLHPADCVVFEDSLAGLESAQRAHCQTVGVVTSHKVHELRPMTDHLIFDFTEGREVLGFRS